MKDAMDGQGAASDDLANNAQAIEHLKSSLAQGKDWIRSLLESMALWTLPEETFRKRRNKYLLDGEAFDWLLLAERLLAEVDGLVPEEARRELLFTGDVSGSVSGEEFKDLLGHQKYSAYLNYWYGVVVEEAVVQCVEEEEWKRIHSGGVQSPSGVTDLAYHRVYGLDQETLLKLFREKKGYPASESMTLTEIKEFTYWLFKYRLQNSDGARVASDTRKGILFLEKMRQEGRAR